MLTKLTWFCFGKITYTDLSTPSSFWLFCRDFASFAFFHSTGWLVLSYPQLNTEFWTGMAILCVRCAYEDGTGSDDFAQVLTRTHAEKKKERRKYLYPVSTGSPTHAFTGLQTKRDNYWATSSEQRKKKEKGKIRPPETKIKSISTCISCNQYFLFVCCWNVRSM